MTFLPYEINHYQGAVIDSSSLPTTVDQFRIALDQTIEQVRKESLQLIWLFLPSHHAEFVPIASKAGFFYHHADGKGLQMILKICPDAFIPQYATHYIGAGGVLLDDENNILIIQERHHRNKHYKLPGGTVEPREHLADAVVREVYEETGIRSSFVSVNCFRHWHGYRHGKSDIYFVCRLKPLSFEIFPDSNEIADALWIPLETYLNDPDTHTFNRKVVETTVNSSGLRLDSIPDYGSPETHEMLFSVQNHSTELKRS